MNVVLDTRCVGYRVDSPDGRVGSVAAVLPPRGDRRETALLLRTGLLSCSFAAISTEAVERIDAERRRVVLSAPSDVV